MQGAVCLITTKIRDIYMISYDCGAMLGMIETYISRRNNSFHSGELPTKLDLLEQALDK